MAELQFDLGSLSPGDKAIYDAIVAQRKSQGAPFGGPYMALMNHPQLCQKIAEMGYYLKFEGHLPRNIYQFVVLSVARQTRATFEWVDHVQHALDAAVPETVIDRLRTHGVAATEFPDPYRLAGLVLRSTLAWQNIPDEIQSGSIKSYGLQGFVELVALSGFYQMFAAINQGFAISLPQDAAIPF